MEKQQKIRVGNGKKMNPNWLKASVCIDTLKEHAFEYKGKMYAKVDVNVFDKPNEYGKDVSISIDQYKPQPKNGEASNNNAVTEAEVIDEDLPF